jgi:hypothetical protein
VPLQDGVHLGGGEEKVMFHFAPPVRFSAYTDNGLFGF